LFDQYLILVQKLRDQGIQAEVQLQKQKIGAQFKVAERKKIPFVIIAGSEEVSKKICNLKNIEKGIEHKNVAFDQIADLMIKG
ncbi:MAG: His/Gly/Thr/Pro-type tRNA ligase C-terminal domain-containing protein, partial [Spirochaetes bacterium]|nr:His/Gly/Thr/Pro-type tRNA ligase C-terminal domain-containing protein [Spirochaetota bacterium]